MQLYSQYELWNRESGLLVAARKAKPDDENSPTIMRMPVLPEGKFEHPYYGELNWTPQRFRMMKENFDNNVMECSPVCNFDHATQNFFAQNAPAAAWPFDLVIQDGEGLFSDCEMTDLGEEAVTNRRYRYTSAEIADEYTNSRGDVFDWVYTGHALTNVPFHASMPGVFAQDQKKRPILCSLKGQVGELKRLPTIWALGGIQQEDRMSREAINKLLSGLPDNPTKEQIAAAMSAARDSGGLSFGQVNSSVGTAGASQAAPETESTQTEAGTQQAAGSDAQAATQQHAQETQAQAFAGRAESSGDAAANRGQVNEPVTFSRAEFDQLMNRMQTLEARDKESQQLLMETAALDVVKSYANKGLFPATKEKLDAATVLALTCPNEFKAFLEGNPPCMPLENKGFGPGGDVSGDLIASGDEFTTLVFNLRKQGVPALEAMKRVAAERPEMYQRYRRETTKPGG